MHDLRSSTWSFLRRGTAAACLALLAWSAAGFADGRESPPERLSVDELLRRAHEIGDRVAVGARTGGATPLAPALLSWVPLGPAPITGDYWSAYGNAAGRVSAIIVHPTSASTAYIGAAGGGVWKTTNAGASWTVLTDGLSSISSGALAFDPSNSNTLYYGTGEQHYSGDSFYGDGLFRSTDAGVGWTKIASKTQVGNYIARVRVSPTSGSILFVASDIGVVRSIDGGSSWSVVLSGGPASWCNDLVMDPSNSSVLYAALYGIGVYKSTDGGTIWALLAGGLPAAGLQRINLAIAPSNGLVLYASFVNASGGLLGMYRTANGGTSWTALGATPNYLRTQGWYDNCLVVDPANANVCYAGGVFPYDAGDTGVIRTADGGASWTDITFGIDGASVHPDQQIMTIGPDGRLWLGNDGGVYTTTDGGLHWSDRNTDLGITQFYKIAVHPNDTGRMLGGTQDNGTLQYAGATAWPQLEAGDGGPSAYEWDSPNIYYSSYVTMFYLSRWNAGTYEGDVTGPWMAAGDRASFLNGPLTVDPNLPNTLLAGTYRAWRTANSGATWTSISGDLTDGGVLRSIAVAWTAPNTIYTGSTDGVVYYTTDASTWTRRSTGLPVAFIPDLLVNPNDAQTVYTCARRGSGDRVFKTVNAGVAWTSVTGDLPGSVAPHSMVVDYLGTPPVLYLGTDFGVYSSTNSGVNWIKETGVPNTAIFDLLIDSAGNLVVSTHGRGMWRAHVRDLVGVGAAAPSASFVLRPVAPNPAAPPVTIRFQLPRAGSASLEIFDLLGRRVASLEVGDRDAGSHEVLWDGKDGAGTPVRGGVYLYRLRAAAFSQTRRLVLIR